jgi:hypothetical protein
LVQQQQNNKWQAAVVVAGIVIDTFGVALPAGNEDHKLWCQRNTSFVIEEWVMDAGKGRRGGFS